MHNRKRSKKPGIARLRRDLRRPLWRWAFTGFALIDFACAPGPLAWLTAALALYGWYPLLRARRPAPNRR